MRAVPALILTAACLAAGGPGWAAGRVGPLAEAVRAGDLARVRGLLKQRADANASESDGSTALHWAADRGDAVAVDLLLRSGARVTVANTYGVTPLSLAVANGTAAVVSRLLKAGADANTKAIGGETALMTAARYGRTEAVQALIEAGADVNAREATRGQTALMWAAAEGHADVVRALVASGADLRATSYGPSVPGDITDGFSIYKRVAPRVDVFTPLQFAVRAGHAGAAAALIDAAAPLTDETPEGMGLLTLAIANAHYDVAELLIRRGADVHAAKVGWTPLIQVVRTRNLNIGQFPHPVASTGVTSLDVAGLLLERGAEVDARTSKPWQDGWRGSFGMRATPFLLAAKGGDTEMMRLLARHGADVKASNALGTTAVMAAAGVEMFNPNEDSGTAAEGLAAVKVALELGGDINGANRNGETPLHGAVHRDNPELVRFLVEAGARLDATTTKGLTPLAWAVNGVGINNGPRPTAAAALRDLMRARGMKADLEEDPNRYTFGVTAR